MRAKLLRCVLGLAALLTLGPGLAYGQSVYCWSGISEDGIRVYGGSVTDDGGMYGQFHTYQVLSTLYNPSGRVSGFGTSEYRIDYNWPINGNWGQWWIEGHHWVWCTYLGEFVSDVISRTYIWVYPPRQFTVTARSFIPMPYVFGGELCFHPFYGETIFMYSGDDRSYDPNSTRYRTESRITVTPNAGWRVDSTSLATRPTRSYAFLFEEDAIRYDCWLWHDQLQASTDNMGVRGEARAGAVMATFLWGNAGNPLSIAPPVDWDHFAEVNNNETLNPRYTITGNHDCFPAHELYISRSDGAGMQLVHDWTPPSYNPSYILNCLLGNSQVRYGPRSGPVY